MSDMIEVVIDSVRVSLMSSQRIIVLRQTDGERFLPIWVGPYEAEAITVALQEIEMSRPLTHDLLKNVFGAFNARIQRVEIVNLRDDTFYGNIVAQADGQEINIDSRPSDAIALAVRAHVPILVHPSVMESAGIIPEKDMPNTPAADDAATPKGTKSATAPDVSTDRLSIFEDFIDKLNLDKLDDKDKKDKPDDDSPPPTKS
ncbi:MAG TPA: bifunctional nuclease family protein [Anaerolineales bacterium]|nr:bifunctional nuclease family protein [Anaerolineales bacterium]